MSDEADNEAPLIDEDDDLNTTAPSPKPDVWKMPEPIFRSTSGKLPQGFERRYGAAAESEAPEPETDPPANEATSSASPASDDTLPALPANDDTRAYQETESVAEPKPKDPTLKMILVLLGLAAMTGFIVVLITVVYFFFVRSAD